MPVAMDLTKHPPFGRLKVIRKADRRPSRPGTRWVCRCECGTEVIRYTQDLMKGDTASCGCLRKQVATRRATRHEGCGTPEYRTWSNIRQRCTNPGNPNFARYGARGVHICRGWDESFTEFRAAVGPRPTPDYSLDRIDVNGGYTCGSCEDCRAAGAPMNVRWATAVEQARNKTTTIRITMDGQTLSLAEWCERLAMPHRSVVRRLTRGWGAEASLKTPLRKMCGVTPAHVRVRKMWRQMVRRCHDPRSNDYPNYGGRGIVVCDRWRESVQNFIDDMGHKPSPKHSLHRLDNDGPYSPENCVWADQHTQSNSQRPHRAPHLTIPRDLTA